MGYGAAGGIGQALSEKLAQKGSHLVLSDTNEAALNQLSEALTKYDIEVIGFENGCIRSSISVGSK